MAIPPHFLCGRGVGCFILKILFFKFVCVCVYTCEYICVCTCEYICVCASEYRPEALNQPRAGVIVVFTMYMLLTTPSLQCY